jgi:tetratricopeptide (TPR) repeat protein
MNRSLKFIITNIILSLLLTYGSAFQSSAAEHQEDERNRAIELFHEGNFADALPVFKKLTNAYPADYLLKYFTGACLVETGHYGKETEMYLLIAISKEVPSKVFYYLGRLYHAQSNWDEALKFYNRFTNNSDSQSYRQLRIRELSQLAYDQYNPFHGSDIIYPDASQTTENEHKQPDIELVVPALLDTQQSDIPAEEPAEKPMDTQFPTGFTAPEASVDEKEEQLPDSLPDQTYVIQTLPAQAARPPVVSIPQVEFINFPVNSQITYITKDMFRQPEAREIWENAVKREVELNRMMESLAQMRNSYLNTSNPAERESLANGIISLERETLIQKAEIDNLFQKAGIMEEKWWEKADYSDFVNYRNITDSLLNIREAVRLAGMTPVPIIENFSGNDDTTDEVSEDEDSEQGEKNDEVIYKVQLGSFKGAVPSRTKQLFDKISKIRPIDTFENEEGATVYTTGNLKTFADGQALQNQVRLEGVKDAFVIAILNEKRISLPEAKILTGEE